MSYCIVERAADDALKEYRTLRSKSNFNPDNLSIWHCNRCPRDFPGMMRHECVDHLEAE